MSHEATIERAADSGAGSLDLKRWRAFRLPADVIACVADAPSVLVPRGRQQLFELSLGGYDSNRFKVSYPVPGKGDVVEATVVRAKNDLVVNYPDPYMRRRDPHSMVVADSGPSEKARFGDRFSGSFEEMRASVLR